MTLSLLPGETLVDDLIHAESSIGRAVFSPDREHRLRLQRWISTREALRDRAERVLAFLMLNPSEAGAHKPDPTIGECCKRTRRLGFDTIDVGNLFTFRSPYPAALRLRPRELRNHRSSETVLLEILRGADLVIAAWGNDGVLDDRADHVARLASQHGIALHCLGTTQTGQPKHPLARGRHRIPDDFVPVRWTP